MGLTSITLGGFQVFDAPTTIPLGRLTFLFGPNSAGKSAVQDALALLHAEISDHGHEHIIERNWRRTGPGNTELVDRMLIGLSTDKTHHVLHCDSSQNLVCGGSLYEQECLISVIYQFIILDRTDGEELLDDPIDWTDTRNIDLSYDSVPLLRFHRGNRAGLNFAHPLLAGSPLYEQVSSLAASNQVDTSSIIVCADGWLEYQSGMRHGLRGRKLNRSDYYERFAKTKADVSLELKQKFDIFADYFDTIYSQIKLNFDTTHWSLDVVPASRTVPTPNDITHLICLHETGFGSPLLGALDDWEKANQTVAVFNLVTEGPPRYKRLAEAFLRMQLDCLSIDTNTPRAKLSGDVNRALTDHLFLERGYRLESEYKAILSKDHFESKILSKGNDVDITRYAGEGKERKVNLDLFTFLVRLFLVDSQGREFSFDEVGSGLGYVLPVLCSVYDGLGSMSVLNQPELHLHPALQAALSDVFIDAASQSFGDNELFFNKQLVIETHSEHILLRVLRRIRQTANGVNLQPELKLRPEDVVVVYFDPSPDGTTTVKRLRISPDGEFIDRWPKGFFTEREEELFD